MADEGRCFSCGFLGKQDRRRDTSVRYPGTYEVEWLERAEPAKARKGVATSANASMPTELVCYRGAAFLPGGDRRHGLERCGAGGDPDGSEVRRVDQVPAGPRPER